MMNAVVCCKFTHRDIQTAYIHLDGWIQLFIKLAFKPQDIVV